MEAIIIKEEEAANDNAGSSAGTKECVRDAIEETSQFACSVQMTEIYIPVQDCQLPRANIVFNEKGEKEELLNEESYPVFNSPNAVGISSDAVDPLEVDDEPLFTEDEKLIGNSKMTNDSTTEAIGLSTPDQVLVETTPTSHLLAERNVWIDLNDDCIGSSASVTHIQSMTVASPCGDGTNVMDKDLKEDIAHHADKVRSNSIPDDGHSYMKHIPASRNSGNGATMTVVGDRRDAPNITGSLRLISVSENRKIGIEAVMENKKEISYCFIKNPRNGKNSNEKLYYCSHCRYEFNTNDDLIKHMEIHSGTSNLDPNDESSMGKDESFTVPASIEGSNNSCESSTSETLMGLERKIRGPMQKVNAPVLEICGGMGERETAERVGSSDEDGKPYTKNMSSKSTISCARNLRNDALGGAKGGPFNCSVCNKSFPLRSGLGNHMRSHKERKCYPCTICRKSFPSKSRITKHLRTHTDEKPFSCSDCMKSFSVKGNLMKHLRTHTGEKPFSCNYCAKAFARKDKLNQHLRVHTGERPFTCEICSKSFASKSHITQHMRTHTQEKPFSCSDCAKSFSLKCSLMKHLRTHTGEKPFSCNHCAKAFTRKDKLI
ncbi:gastrula zinc finger protein XlCGF26.1-like, partial [Ischnura elegans]|uniref:gastrula zinc finger protein XlCGF26.1-like n=1 Tax=Ischnura elegans TaxID=197161 RepID=UPI001ED86B14